MSVLVKAYDTGKSVVLNNGAFARAITIPAGWAKLRLGLLMRINPVGSLITLNATPSLSVGFCVGTSNIMGDATTTLFCGARTTAASWVAGPVVYTAVTWSSFSRKAGAADYGSGGGGDGSSSAFTGVSATTDRNLLYVDISNGGSPWTSVTMMRPDNFTLASVTPTQFWNNLTISSPVLGGYIYSGVGATVQTNLWSDLQAGPLSINVHWDRTDAEVYIDALGLAVLG